MLPLLLSLQIEPSQSTEVLLANSLVDGGAPTYPFAVVVRRVRPPIGLHFDVAQDHVFYGSRQAGHLHYKGLSVFKYSFITN